MLTHTRAHAHALEFNMRFIGAGCCDVTVSFSYFLEGAQQILIGEHVRQTTKKAREFRLTMILLPEIMR